MWIFLALVVMFGTSFAQEPFCPVCSKCEHEEKVLERALNKNIVPVVLFHARLNLDDISYNVNDRILYRDGVVNEGGGYDQYTGIFAASVAGLYMFTVHSCNAKDEWASVEIVHGGRPLQRSNIWDKEKRICSSMQSFAKVAIGEKIWVRSTWDNIVVYSDEKFFWNTFSGLLIHI